MSDAYNHYFCGMETMIHLPKHIADIIDKNFYILGTQGADIFFYYNLFNWKKPVPYGKLIHNQKINAFFNNMIEYINNEKDIISANKLFSYLFGLITHHSLDSLTHPYIVYHSGVHTKDNNESKLYKFMHKKFEILLDVALLKYRYGIIARQYNIQSLLRFKSMDLNLLSDMYKSVINTTYKINVKEDIVEKSTLCQRLCLSFLINDSLIINKLITLGEKTFYEKGMLTSGMYPRSTNESLILNLNKSTWFHPCNKKESTSSYAELFEDSIVDSLTKIIKIYELRNTLIKTINISDIFHDISYETGLPCIEPHKPLYYDIDFARKLINL